MMDRRTFVKQSGTLAAGAYLAPQLVTKTTKKKLAMVGTGHRGEGMWGTPVISEFANQVEFVGLCDINPGRVSTAKEMMKLTCPTYTDFDKMMKETKPDMLIVTTVDGTHHDFIVKGLE